MADPLLPFLLLLTLLDLGFVHATGAVGGLGMLPLWLMTLAAPWLRRMQRHRPYRALWNGGVLVVFALLVHHATTTGLLHMLEDGLLLAVLCQVHLLNNVGERQRPDLVFFNSFLIAFVTSFFAPDLSWSALFVLHSFALVPSLEVHALTRHGRAIEPGLVRALLRDSVPRTLAIGTATALVFVLWPRDFARTGWIGDALDLGHDLEAGLAERIHLDREQPVRLGNQIVARFEPLGGSLDRVPTHWRANAFAVFDGNTWYPQDAGRLGTRFATDLPWERDRDGGWSRPSSGAAELAVRVRMYEQGSHQLLLPLGALHLAPENGDGLLLDPRSHGGFGVLRTEDAPGGPLVYTVTAAARAPTARPTAAVRAHFTALPDGGVPQLVFDLARQLRSALAKDAEDLAIAAATGDWLAHNRRYQLPGEAGFARNLGDFLLGTGAGHCEYFATALALLLRVQGVPCRLVGGYLVHEDDADAGGAVARARDAHAWVEVMDASGAWHTFDATPPADVLRDGAAGSGFWQATIADVERLWAAIAGFDTEARRRCLATALAFPGEHPLGTALLLLGAAVLLHRRRRRRQRLPAIVDLERALRRARVQLEPGETPREALARATAAGAPPAAVAGLRTALAVHERQRYAAVPRSP